MKNFRVSSIYGFLGVGLSLVALYLVLERAGGASQLMTSAAGGLSQVYRTLQGR